MAPFITRSGHQLPDNIEDNPPFKGETLRLKTATDLWYDLGLKCPNPFTKIDGLRPLSDNTILADQIWLLKRLYNRQDNAATPSEFAWNDRFTDWRARQKATLDDARQILYEETSTFLTQIEVTERRFTSMHEQCRTKWEEIEVGFNEIANPAWDAYWELQYLRTRHLNIVKEYISDMNESRNDAIHRTFDEIGSDSTVEKVWYSFSCLLMQLSWIYEYTERRFANILWVYENLMVSSGLVRDMIPAEVLECSFRYGFDWMSQEPSLQSQIPGGLDLARCSVNSKLFRKLADYLDLDLSVGLISSKDISIDMIAHRHSEFDRPWREGI